jgi:GTP-binding protein
LGWRGESYIISALTGEGCRELVLAVMAHLERAGQRGPRRRAQAPVSAD